MGVEEVGQKNKKKNRRIRLMASFSLSIRVQTTENRA